jgi:sterol desaturase/sphingolipid hydroxylase (fatty acid hydroxylase superfamily)
LWRLHRAHHSDLDLDVTTSSRFHLGEVTLSTVYKIGFIWVLGVSPLGLVALESALLFAAQAQHSNLRIPEPFETMVRWIFVTPHMHRIHHSQEVMELNSNFSTIFSWWDRLIGTYQMEVRQEGIMIGLKDYPATWNVTLWQVLLIPFGKSCKA